MSAAFVPLTSADAQDEPNVLPARVPHLLVNGAAGIAVGIATKIPPHNLREVVAAMRAMIDNPSISLPQLMRHIPGPDFPTGAGGAQLHRVRSSCKLTLQHACAGGEIVGADSIKAAFATGKGSITLRGVAEIQTEGPKKGTLPGFAAASGWSLCLTFPSRRT